MKHVRVGRFLLVSTILIFVVFVGECMGGPETITVWFHAGKGKEREIFNAQVKKFNQLNPAIQVQAAQLSEGSYSARIQVAALSGKLPCLLDFDGPFIYTYIWSGALIPLDQYVSDELRHDFLPSIIMQGTYAGKLYSLGAFDSSLALWGNQGYLQKAGVRIPKGIHDPWTKAEFLEALQKLSVLKKVEYVLDLKMNYGQGEWYTYGFAPILQSFGGDLIDRQSYQSADGVLNGVKAVEGLTFFQNLFRKSYVNSKPAGDDAFYGKQSAALAYVGQWMWEPHKAGLDDDLILLPMPKFGDNAVTAMGSWNWGITSACPNPEAAWKFLEYLLAPEEILRMTTVNNAIPARQSALAKSPVYRAGGPLRLFVEQLENGIAMPRPITPAYPVITNAFAEAVQHIVNGAEVKTELDQAVKKIDQDIEANQGYSMSK